MRSSRRVAVCSGSQHEKLGRWGFSLNPSQHRRYLKDCLLGQRHGRLQCSPSARVLSRAWRRRVWHQRFRPSLFSVQRASQLKVAQDGYPRRRVTLMRPFHRGGGMIPKGGSIWAARPRIKLVLPPRRGVRVPCLNHPVVRDQRVAAHRSPSSKAARAQSVRLRANNILGMYHVRVIKPIHSCSRSWARLFGHHMAQNCSASTSTWMSFALRLQSE